MIPGFGGRNMNPKRLNAMMKQMGIEVEDIDDVVEVVIRTKEKEIVFRDATVSKMVAQGQTTWQLMGSPEERALAPKEPVKITFNAEDITLVMEQAKVDEKTARAALEATNGQPAEAILKLLGE